MRARREHPALPPDLQRVKEATSLVKGTPVTIYKSESEKSYYWFTPSGFPFGIYGTVFPESFLDNLKSKLMKKRLITPKTEWETLAKELTLPEGYKSRFYILDGFSLLSILYPQDIFYIAYKQPGKKGAPTLYFYYGFSDDEIEKAFSTSKVEGSIKEKFNNSLTKLDIVSAISQRLALVKTVEEESERLKEDEIGLSPREEIPIEDERKTIIFLGKCYAYTSFPTLEDTEQLDDFPHFYDRLVFGLKDMRSVHLITRLPDERYDVVTTSEGRLRKPVISVDELSNSGIAYKVTEDQKGIMANLPFEAKKTLYDFINTRGSKIKSIVE